MIGKQFGNNKLPSALNVLYGKKGKIDPTYVSKHNSNNTPIYHKWLHKFPRDPKRV